MRTKPIDNELVETAARSFLTRGIVPTTPQIQDSIGFGHAGDIRPILLKFLYEELSRLSVEVLELRQGRGGPRDRNDRSEYGSSQSASTHEDLARLSDRVDTLNDHLNDRLRDAISAHEEERVAHEATRRDLLAQLDAERARADRERDRCQVLSDRLIEIIGLLAPKVAGDPGFTIEAGSAAALFAPVESEFSEAEPPPFEVGEARRPTFGPRSDAAPAKPSFDRREDESLTVLRDLFADDDDLGDDPEDGDLEEDGEALVLQEAVEEDESEDDTESEDEDDAFGGGFGHLSAARGHSAPEPRDSSPEDDIAGILARLRAKDDRPPPARDPDYSQLFDLAARDGGPSLVEDKPPEKPKRGFFRRG